MRLRVGQSVAAAAMLLAALPDISAGQRRDAGPERRIRYYEADWDFDDVDVGKLTGRLRRIGIDIPVTLEGRVSGELSVGVPWGALRDAHAWRFGGLLTSLQLTVTKFTMRDLSVRI
jgi:hypothetical protein